MRWSLILLIGLSVSASADSLQSAQTDLGNAYARFYESLKNGQAGKPGDTDAIRHSFQQTVGPASAEVNKAFGEGFQQSLKSAGIKLNLEGGTLASSSEETGAREPASFGGKAGDVIDGSQFPKELEFPGPVVAPPK